MTKNIGNAVFWGVVVGAAAAISAYAALGFVAAANGDAPAAQTIPKMEVVDESDELAQQHRPHEVEAVEAGKLDANGVPIDGEKPIVAKMRAAFEQRLAEMAANAAENEGEAVSDGVSPEDEYVYQTGYNWGARDISQVKMATTTEELLGGDGVHRDGDGNTYTWYYHDIGDGPIDDRIPGCHYDENGVAYDEDGYIAVARSDYDPEVETIIDTPYGPAKLYDSCPIYGNVDIYTNR